MRQADPRGDAEAVLSVLILALSEPTVARAQPDAAALAAEGCRIIWPSSWPLVDADPVDFAWLPSTATLSVEEALLLSSVRTAAIPVFSAGSSHTPNSTSEDPAEHVAFVETVPQALALLRSATPAPPTPGLRRLQRYYAETAKRRGYCNEGARDCLLLLTEEVGELARAVRKNVGLAREAGYAGVSVASELADVQLYLLHLANILRLDLGDAVVDKEHENHQRFLERVRRDKTCHPHAMVGAV